MASVLTLCAVLILLGVGWLLKLAQDRWLAPGPFFAVYWAVALAVPPLLAPQFFYSSAAVWYIVALVAAFGLGSVAAAARPPVRTGQAGHREINVRGLRWLVTVGTGAGLAATVLIQSANGYSVTAILSFQGLLDASAAFSEARYTGGIYTPPLVPLLLGFTYAAAMVAPFAARGLSKPWAVACCVGPLVGATLYAIVTTARAGMLTSFVFLFAGWMAARIWHDGETPRIGVRRFLGGATAAVVGGVAFVLIAFLRVGSFDDRFQKLIIEKLGVYGFGYLSTFSQWLADAAPTGPRAWGSAAIAGITSPFGIGEQYGQAFTDFRPIGATVPGKSNIYTGWRYLVEDWGVAGAVLAAAVLGYVATRVWARLVERRSVPALVGYLCLFGTMAHWVTLSIFTFTNVVVAAVIAAVALSLRADRQLTGRGAQSRTGAGVRTLG
jgi:oligosaccharide repeat unit polymerase